MNTHSWLILAAVLAPLASAACSVTTVDPTGSGGSTSSATVTSATATSTSATTSGGGGDCAGVFPAGACATCGEASCCAQGAACDATAGCISCVYSSDPTCTEANKPVVDALLACLHASCEAACFPAPLTPIDATCAAPTTSH